MDEGLPAGALCISIQGSNKILQHTIQHLSLK